MKKPRSLRYRIEQWLWTFGSLIVLLFPTWIWLTIYKIIGPSNFIEKFLVFGAGVYMGGALQVILLGLWVSFLIAVVWE